MAAATAQTPPASLAAIKADTTAGGSTLAMKASCPPSTKDQLTEKAAFITFPRSSIFSIIGIMEIQVARLMISPTTE